MKVSGRIHLFGDHVDTDVILPTHAIVNTDPQVLAQNCFSGIIPGFVDTVRAGDFIIAGENFGCGSSREHA
ncbi:MAG: 3-isopropylmalate dehydratase small subunit, partial [Betaproteobacteria bacterium]|nr:3-isopropylmalate dehydratase small subunit [Betaproteobacteria bacterium]